MPLRVAQRKNSWHVPEAWEVYKELKRALTYAAILDREQGFTIPEDLKDELLDENIYRVKKSNQLREGYHKDSPPRPTKNSEITFERYGQKKEGR